MGSILEVFELTTKLHIAKRDVKVVDQLSFSLHSGKTLALVGESGSGKTMAALSLLRILPDPPALRPEGKVIYQGKNLLEMPEKDLRKIRGGKIAMIFQDPMSSLNPVFTVGEQLLEVAYIHLQVGGEEAMDLALQALREVNMTSPEKVMVAYPHQLSGGMKQRVMIAMALIAKPDILIADEPTTALDVTIQKQVLNLMKDLQQKIGMALLLITHDMGIVAEMADEVVVMYATQGVEWGKIWEILNFPAHPYTQGLFSCLPDRRPFQQPLQVIKGTVPPPYRLPSGCLFHPRCPYAMPICKEGKVPEFATNSSRHRATCWLYDPESPSKAQGESSASVV